MSTFNRRRFLQLTGMSAATFAIWESWIARKSYSYGRLLTQETSRKRALLVGVNRYPDSDRFTPLQGCTTDILLRRALLVYRFGFHPNDICILSNDPADKPLAIKFLQHFKVISLSPVARGIWWGFIFGE